MGKEGYRKFMKKERAKVKLKGVKVLPKGQNITNTNFKIKKIVIKDQIKKHLPNEVLSKKKLNKKELLSRLDHHNPAVRQNAIEGLKELLSDYPESTLGFEAAQLINGVAKLILDVKPEVRKAASKLLRHILSQLVSSIQLTPVFTSLCSYLICGLTHIDHSIRIDSLHVLDTLLICAPQLCAKQAVKLLPICLDLVSDSNTGSRTLSLHLESRESEAKWRSRVLLRISAILSTVTYSQTVRKEINPSDVWNENTPTIHKWKENEKNYVPISYQNPDLFKRKSRLKLSASGSSDEYLEFDFKEFALSIIPLALDAFMELVPNKETKVDFHASGDDYISRDAAKFLFITLDIIEYIWAILHSGNQGKENTSWMQEKFASLVLNRLVANKFPYKTIPEQKCRNKGKEVENNRDFFGSENSVPSTYKLNLKLCKVVVLLSDEVQWKPIISYVKHILRAPEKLGEPESEALLTCLFQICWKSEGDEVKDIISSMAKLCTLSQCLLSRYMFRLLVEISLSEKCSFFHSDPQFQNWLSELPKLLLEKMIMKEHLEAITEISRREFSQFSEAFDGYIEGILDNIPETHAVGIEDEEAHMRIAELLFWVQDWDEELLNGIIKGIRNNYWGDAVTKHIIEILLLMYNFKRSPELNELLLSHSWWCEYVGLERNIQV